MSWFSRKNKNITTSTTEKKETPEGLWYKCPSCKKIHASSDHAANLWVCSNCNHHERINSREYFQILFDSGKYEELFTNIRSDDPLKFEDTKKYKDRLKASIEKSGYTDAMSVGYGTVEGVKLVIACMNFDFIGGSMGSVVGEKISRAIDYCIKHKSSLLIISKSGGARMMEAAFSLMQMAKTSAKLTQLSDAALPYISLLTDPTTGGVTASYAMLGDLNIAEPGALIGFAGPRVVKETIGKDLPEGFQTAEFVLEHGFLDMIIERRDMKQQLSEVLKMLLKQDCTPV
ncbi:MAG: acetyl-CoA carboxylase carboxyltransferase subunit beta, partial [Bacteroidetes bacterium]|nr:acetyl-CoA carboxylase carboxyltransferase subunit beta [Bacteroidota bacterium]